MLPRSQRFVPTDEELFDYLQYKILYPEVDLQIKLLPILDYDIYLSDPEDLPSPRVLGEEINEKYYTVLRRMKDGRGVSDYGWWKSSTKKELHDDEEEYIGRKTQFKYFKYINGIRSTLTGEPTNWIMHEYSYPSITHIDEWVLCRIRNRDDEDQY